MEQMAWCSENVHTFDPSRRKVCSLLGKDAQKMYGYIEEAPLNAGWTFFPYVVMMCRSFRLGGCLTEDEAQHAIEQWWRDNWMSVPPDNMDYAEEG